ncbi:flagellar hook-length control protein FliK [Telmatospirillum sp. J64-1]|uniref:flagellar hook-length control protein FliK n=1 Tax=Telmatospirillum sp. J64-1 TaxID=2502183 RepID=UPI00115E07D0|nr:flagellar hook-length control protein FliK [Telmatospirillum sp. J64-1]
METSIIGILGPRSESVDANIRSRSGVNGFADLLADARTDAKEAPPARPEPSRSDDSRAADDRRRAEAASAERREWRETVRESRTTEQNRSRGEAAPGKEAKAETAPPAEAQEPANTPDAPAQDVATAPADAESPPAATGESAATAETTVQVAAPVTTEAQVVTTAETKTPATATAQAAPAGQQPHGVAAPQTAAAAPQPNAGQTAQTPQEQQAPRPQTTQAMAPEQDGASQATAAQPQTETLRRQVAELSSVIRDSGSSPETSVKVSVSQTTAASVPSRPTATQAGQPAQVAGEEAAEPGLTDEAADLRQTARVAEIRGAEGQPRQTSGSLANGGNAGTPGALATAANGPSPAQTAAAPQGQVQPAPAAQPQPPQPAMAAAAEPVLHQEGTSRDALGSLHTTQVQSTAATERAAAAQAAPRAMPTPPATQVAAHIQRAVAEKQDRITIQLRPAHLGRIDVQLDLSEGRIQAVVTADQRDTLELLQRDSRGLEQALKDAGLQTDSNSLNFQLRGQGGRGQSTASGHNDGKGDAQGNAEESVASQQPAPAKSSRGGLDIQV